MEQPILSFSAEDIRDEKVKVLRAIPPVEQKDTLLRQCVSANGKPGYLDDDTVPQNSVCPTYAATALWINNPSIGRSSIHSQGRESSQRGEG
ncbi:hypothetical protein E1B28_011570 [Marasmius oreades]|uniref:Glucose-6-phosphate 1-dehydrogenase n=1 Tax=Marasmius oreades TaxID=181124 RepID=A0A9P7URC1_9AGAR|nr:uncharacterized protein E1B28_011570 [Marasmius oreades]KAG7089941.1 hypothetical protein E1B28_011570 [Marasmius oreades]